MKPSKLKLPAGVKPKVQRPGSRGGKVIGHEKDGDPIYASSLKGKKPRAAAPTAALVHAPVWDRSKQKSSYDYDPNGKGFYNYYRDRGTTPRERERLEKEAQSALNQANRFKGEHVMRDAHMQDYYGRKAAAIAGLPGREAEHDALYAQSEHHMRQYQFKMGHGASEKDHARAEKIQRLAENNPNAHEADTAAKALAAMRSKSPIAAPGKTIDPKKYGRNARTEAATSWHKKHTS